MDIVTLTRIADVLETIEREIRFELGELDLAVGGGAEKANLYNLLDTALNNVIEAQKNINEVSTLVEEERYE